MSIPYGISNAIIVVLMPYLLRKHGVVVDQIADIAAIATIPSIWYFVYSPIVDMGLQRRTWLILASAGAAAFSGVGVFVSTGSLTLITVLLFLSSTLAGLLSTANGALLTALPANHRSRAGGWFQAGNLGGGAVGGGAAVWLAEKLSVHLLAVAATLLIAAPSLAAFFVKESRLGETALTGHLTLRGKLRRLGGDLRGVVRSQRTLVGLVFILSPVGSAAVANLISGVGPDYQASATQVALISGLAGGLLSALGSLIGGFVCDHIDVRKGYSLAGALSASFALYLAAAPRTASTYGIGYSGYSIAAGFAYAVFTALVLEVLGPRRHAAGTAYSLLVAGGNVPIVYMTWLDGLGYKHWHINGLMGVDALANGAGAIALLLFAGYTRRAWVKVPEEIIEPLLPPP